MTTETNTPAVTETATSAVEPVATPGKHISRHTDEEIFVDKDIDPLGKVFKFQRNDDTFAHWLFVDKGPSKEHEGNTDYTVYDIDLNVTDTVDYNVFHEFLLEFILDIDYIPVEEYSAYKVKMETAQKGK